MHLPRCDPDHDPDSAVVRSKLAYRSAERQNLVIQCRSIASCLYIIAADRGHGVTRATRSLKNKMSGRYARTDDILLYIITISIDNWITDTVPGPAFAGFLTVESSQALPRRPKSTTDYVNVMGTANCFTVHNACALIVN